MVTAMMHSDDVVMVVVRNLPASIVDHIDAAVCVDVVVMLGARVLCADSRLVADIRLAADSRLVADSRLGADSRLVADSMDSVDVAAGVQSAEFGDESSMMAVVPHHHLCQCQDQSRCVPPL